MQVYLFCLSVVHWGLAYPLPVALFLPVSHFSCQCHHGVTPAFHFTACAPQMQPIADRLLVRPLEEEPRSAGGILLPKGPPKVRGGNCDCGRAMQALVYMDVLIPQKVCTVS